MRETRATESPKPRAPESPKVDDVAGGHCPQAHADVDQQVTVEFEVKSTGGERNRYLNSAPDFSAANNFSRVESDIFDFVS